ncbi:MAG: UDP-N-acetylmuramate dehydrogenase [Burkholderiales bacterium]|nr:UDP-N-acetylmuramate dehydrogenase [Burkholderiales bacterium]
MNVYPNYCLSHLNTLRLVSSAQFFISLTAVDDLLKIAEYIHHDSQKFFVLGGGSNLILPEVYSGLVIYNQLKGIELLSQDNTHALVRVMAGEVWDDFVAYTLHHNWFGLENLSLIPGTVGAAPIQNIGAYGVEVKDFIDSVYIYDIMSKQIVVLSNKECDFSYRSSIFKTKSHYIVTAVVFKLLKQAQLNTNYGDIGAKLAEIQNPTANQLRTVVINIRSSKLPDPKLIGNVGSFFHNPILELKMVEKLKNQFPNLPVYPLDHVYAKVSAGWLIDNLGLKGYRSGNVGVYHKQALVLINHDRATKTEILNLAKFIQNEVFAAYQIRLNIEPIIIG